MKSLINYCLIIGITFLVCCDFSSNKHSEEVKFNLLDVIEAEARINSIIENANPESDTSYGMTNLNQKFDLLEKIISSSDDSLAVLKASGVIEKRASLINEYRKKVNSISKSTDKENRVNKWLKEYAGGYTVEVKGYPSNSDAELFVLKPDGSAKWMWVYIDSQGNTKIDSEKSGWWYASRDEIKISIQGNTGIIDQEFKMIGGKFISGDHSLKRTE